MRAAVVTLFGVLLLCPAAGEARDRKGPTILQERDGRYVRLSIDGDPAAQAWLYRPTFDDDDDEDEDAEAPSATEDRKRDLIVALHGAGGQPKNFVLPLLMTGRGAWCLAPAGRTRRGAGFLWGAGDVEYVNAFVRHLLATQPIDPRRVIVWGHSQGGGMTLAALAEAPELFAGGLTSAAPRVPDGRVADKRVCVILGKDDPNWGGAGSVRSYVAKLTKRKRAKGACAFIAVDMLGHELPADGYLDLGFDWILHGRGRGGEAHVGLIPKGRDGAYRHILVRHKGAEGAEDVKRSKRAAEKLLKGVRKALAGGRAFFPFEAAVHSEHARTASGGGGIDGDALTRILGSLPALEPGSLSELVRSPHGLHLVYRPVPGPEDDEADD